MSKHVFNNKKNNSMRHFCRNLPATPPPWPPPPAETAQQGYSRGSPRRGRIPWKGGGGEKNPFAKNNKNTYCFLSKVCTTCWTSARAQRSTGLPASPPVSSPSRATHQSQSAIIWTSGLPARYVTFRWKCNIVIKHIKRSDNFRASVPTPKQVCILYF